MTLTELKNKSASNEDYNSCNDWGFGGWVGKIYHFHNGCKMHVGKQHYRHMPSTKVERYWNADGQEISKKEFEKIFA